MERKPLFKIEKTGLQTTFQDLGRSGYQQYGVPVSGAMDRFSLQMANLLVGNSRGEAGIEITMMGPELVAKSGMIVALCGADLSPAVNGESVLVWKSFRLEEGDRLTFGTPKSGLRCYLAVSGGFDIPVVMGSKSTYARAKLGTDIKKGDTVYGFDGDGQPGIGLSRDKIPEYRK
ncbi:MAG TPA: KipI antagonist, partial [Bacillales bacterium]